VIVLDVPPDTIRFTEELWLGMTAKRFKAWGTFDQFIIAALPAKELRAFVRVKGVASASDEYKALVLKRKITDLIDDARTYRPAPSRRARS